MNNRDRTKKDASQSLAGEASVTLPTAAIISPKVRMVCLVIASPILVAIAEENRITVNCTDCNIEYVRECSIDLFVKG